MRRETLWHTGETMAKKARRPTIIPVECEDKDFDTAPPHDHPVSMPRGSRIGVVSDPGRGKSGRAAALCHKCPAGIGRVEDVRAETPIGSVPMDIPGLTAAH